MEQEGDSFQIPDHLPPEFFSDELLVESPNDEYDDRVYNFEIIANVYRILDLVDGIMDSDMHGGLDFVESPAWQIIQGSIYGLSMKNRRRMFKLLPRNLWTHLPELSLRHYEEIDKEYSARMSIMRDVNEALSQFRDVLINVFSTGMSSVADVPDIESFEKVIMEDDIDEKVKVLCDIFPQYLERSERIRDLAYHLERKLQNDEFMRFHLWNSIMGVLRIDPKSYPFFTESYVPAESEAPHIYTLNCFRDVIGFFVEFVLSRDISKLDTLRSFFPDDLFENVDRDIYWTKLESFVHGELESESLMLLFSGFLELFVEEYEEGYSIDMSTLNTVIESRCDQRSNEDLEDF